MNHVKKVLEPPLHDSSCMLKIRIGPFYFKTGGSFYLYNCKKKVHEQ